MADGIISQGFKLEIGDVGDSPALLTEIKDVTTFSGFDGQAAEIEITNLQSTAKEYLMGLEDAGAFNVDINYTATDPGQSEARTARAARTLKSFLVTFSDATTAAFDAYVLSNPITGGVDAKVDSSFSMRITGSVTFA